MTLPGMSVGGWAKPWAVPPSPAWTGLSGATPPTLGKSGAQSVLIRSSLTLGTVKLGFLDMKACEFTQGVIPELTP